MNIQKGGVDPLLKVPTFKYTTSIDRQRFINAIYPYSVYFLDTLNKIDFSSYSYDGACEYIIAKVDNDQQFTPSEEIIVSDYEDILQVTNQITIASYSQDSPKSYYFGGTVYEILNRRFRNPDLHNPYLAIGAIAISGLAGVNEKLIPANQINENLYKATLEKLNELKIESLPKDFNEALENFKKTHLEGLSVELKKQIIALKENVRLI